MNKYIDAEKLIAEIERLIKSAQYKEENEWDFFFSGEVQGYKNIITIITSLQQEQPEVDLEKEIKNEIDEYWYDSDYGAIQRHGGTTTMEISDVKEIAHHFAEWGAIHLNARKEELL